GVLLPEPVRSEATGQERHLLHGAADRLVHLLLRALPRALELEAPRQDRLIGPLGTAQPRRWFTTRLRSRLGTQLRFSFRNFLRVCAHCGAEQQRRDQSYDSPHAQDVHTTERPPT